MVAPTGIHDPITATEAARAFQQIWKLGGGRTNFMRLGFAISGGVDSMALAYLWSRIRLNKAGYNPYVRGFVVDHGLRPGSAEEAQLVAASLEPFLGWPGQVVTLNWRNHSSSPNTQFETVARRLRFQALAKAAHDNGVQCLVLGHHSDDVIETTLFRMTKEAQGRGLLGRRSLSNIPECHGQFGISESGSFTRLQTQRSLNHYVGGPEEGGLTIARPLINFPKSRLIATCKESNVKWVEDTSNQDLRLTPRNVIRNMLQTDVLPQALRKASVKQFVNRVEENQSLIASLATRLHEATYIRSLDLRSGVLEVYLPHHTFIEILIEEVHDRELVFQAFADLWRDLVSSVSPDERVIRRQLLAFAQLLFETILDGATKVNQMISPGSRIVAELLNPLVIDSKPSGHLGLRLFRAAYSNSVRGYDRPASIELPPMVGQYFGRSRKLVRPEDFQLWDGRFWISLRNTSSVPLRLVSLNREMLTAYRKQSQGIRFRDFDAIFKEAAPGNSRWTIPAIICEDEPPQDSRILGTPCAFARIPSKTRYIPSFEIYKYSSFNPNESTEQSHLGPWPGYQKTIPLHAVNPHLFRPEDNLSRRPQSQRELIRLPYIREGKKVAANRYIVETPFVVAIPTMGLFLNNYWAKHLTYDIRYKKIPLQGMHHVSRYRMEKWTTNPGHLPARESPRFVGERVTKIGNEK